MTWSGFAGRLSVSVLALVVIGGAACEPGAKGATASPEASPPKQAAASPVQASPSPASSVASNLPKHCGDRIPVATVSTALGKAVKLTKELPDPRGLLCYYDVESASPNPAGFAGRVIYTVLDHPPTRKDVNDFIEAFSSGGTYKVEETSGVGDYSAWITGTITQGGTTVSGWDFVATKGNLMAEFGTHSLAVAQGDRAKMQEVVRKALG